MLIIIQTSQERYSNKQVIYHWHNQNSKTKLNKPTKIYKKRREKF